MNKPFHNILILSDFDGTFAGENGRIVPRNLEAIAHFKELGGHFTFSTGRLPSVMKKIYPDFCRLINAPAIMCNGALLYDAEADTVLKEIFFDGKQSRPIVKDILSRFPEMNWVVYSDSGKMLSQISPDEVPGDCWRKMRFDCPSPARVTECQQYILQNYGDYYNCIRSWHTVVEIVDKQASKGNLIRMERDYFLKKGIEALTVCCIGDFENDIDMLKHADIAFCPENAIDSVKQLSRHILCHHDSGAVADMIEEIEKEMERRESSGGVAPHPTGAF